MHLNSSVKLCTIPHQSTFDTSTQTNLIIIIIIREQNSLLNTGEGLLVVIKEKLLSSGQIISTPVFNTMIEVLWIHVCIVCYSVTVLI